MKNPLSYQSTEYDCGPTTVINAINYLFPREEIYPDVVKCIMQYCLDSYNDYGEAYKNGTTGMAMMFLANWLNHFGQVKKWPIQCSMVNGREVYVSENSRIGECLQHGGVVVARVMLECWHYVLLTGMEGQQVYLFDPYYVEGTFPDKRIQIISDSPKKMNRIVSRDLLNGTGTGDYELGEKEQRECMLIYNQNVRKTMDDLEYII